MKNLLDSDFSDYYDQELYLPEHAPSLVLKRRKDTDLTIMKQIEILSLSGFNTLNKGDFLSVFYALKMRNHKVQGWELTTHVATQDDHIISVFDFINGERCVKEPVVEFYSNRNENSDFFRYIQIGPNHFWLHAKTLKYNIFKSPSLPLKQIVLINKPLFSIDFKMVEGELVATGFSDAPLLKGTGIESYLTPAEVADLITLGLETNCIDIPEFAMV